MPPGPSISSLTALRVSNGVRTASWSCRVRQAPSSSSIPPPPPLRTSPCTRQISSTPQRLKKAGKSNQNFARSDSSPPVNPKDATRTPTDEVYDFSELENKILKAIERLTHELSLLRPGGRFNPELLDRVWVEFRHHGEVQQKERLVDVAQIIPKGRAIEVVVGDEDHIKPVKAAIFGTPYSLNPEGPTPDAPTTLTIRIPPPNAEARSDAVAKAHQLGQQAKEAIDRAKTAHDKNVRKLEVAKLVRGDDMRKAKQQSSDIAKKANEQAKGIVEQAKRVIERA